MHEPPALLIVAHGSPSDPVTQEGALMALATRVRIAAPGLRVAGTTLAAPGAFEAAVARLEQPQVYPFFMADGVFVRRMLADRAAPFGLDILPPFGLDPGLDAAVIRELRATLTARGWRAAETTLLVAAHGSAVSQRNAETTVALAGRMAAACGFARAVCGFVEQAPQLTEAAQGLGQAICLPFFALRAGHYVDDVPDALAAAGFTGPVLPPFIEWAATADLIAASVTRQTDTV